VLSALPDAPIFLLALDSWFLTLHSLHLSKKKFNLKPLMEHNKTWHQMHQESLEFGQRLADKVANGMGSWRFIIIQTLIVALWMTLNVIGITYKWDVYPFILLNLLFSTQAAYAAPIIMMAQNRQSERDRAQADADYRTNCEAKIEIEELLKKLNSIEVDKLDRILELLEKNDKKA